MPRLVGAHVQPGVWLIHAAATYVGYGKWNSQPDTLIRHMALLYPIDSSALGYLQLDTLTALGCDEASGALQVSCKQASNTQH